MLVIQTNVVIKNSDGIKIIHQLLVSSASCDRLINAPQLAEPGGIPNPRKLSVASAAIDEQTL
jgi:hypothetical protein